MELFEEKRFSWLHKRTLFVICLLNVAVLLVVGFRPLKFRFSNDVNWIEGRDGLQFGHRGIAYTRNTVNLGNGEFSLELLVKPERARTWGVDYILEINDGNEPALLSIGQWNSHLIFRSREKKSYIGKGYYETSISDLFHQTEERQIVITSGPGGLYIYSAGDLVRSIPGWKLNGGEKYLEGRIVLGNSADGRKPWHGRVLRLILANGKNRHEYQFSEGQGYVAMDTGNGGEDLLIPETFKTVKKQILVPPWRTRSDLIDITVNILGFIPLGFFLTLYLIQALKMKARSAYITAIGTGVALSLFIEIVQVFIPVRYSSSGDLILNSLGTAIGVGCLKLFTMHFQNKKKRGFF